MPWSGAARELARWAKPAVLAGLALSSCRWGYTDLLEEQGAAAGSEPGGGVAAAGSSGGTLVAASSQGAAAGVGSSAGGDSGQAGDAVKPDGPCSLETAPGASYAPGELASLNGFYVLRHVESDRCLQTNECAALDGSAYELGNCNYERCQVFQALERDADAYSLINAGSGYCLTNSADQSSALDVTCAPPATDAEPTQRLQLMCAGADSWYVFHPQTGTYLTPRNAASRSFEFRELSSDTRQRFSVQARSNIFEPILPTSEAAPGVIWRYTTSPPDATWQQANFDDSGWAEGRGGFGDGLAFASPSRTTWLEGEIWLRTTFELAALPAVLDARINHDLDARVYINGTQIAALNGWTSGYRQYALPQAALASLQLGTNVIAVHCTKDAFGEQFIDVGLGTYAF